MNTEIAAIAFNFQHKNYQALVRVKQRLNGEQYCVTIMNGDLERLLFGHHIFVFVDGKLRSLNPPTAFNTAELAENVAAAVHKHYKRHEQMEQQKAVA